MIALSHFLIVEDELLIAETISEYLKYEGCNNITIVESVDEATFVLENHKIDFVLTDIALGQRKSGIELGQIIQTTYKIPFIYITSHTDKTMIERAKHTMPDAYIVKPFKKDDLIIAIDFALYNASNKPLKTNEKNELIVKEGRSLVRLFHENILWLEADGNYTTIHLKKDKRRVVRYSLSEVEVQLDSTNFIRIHKSFLVNKTHITEIKTNTIIIGDQELSIGRTYQQNIVDVFK